MNILITLDSNYVKPLCVMLRSLIKAHPEKHIDIYAINKSLTGKDFEFISSKLESDRYVIHDIKIDDRMLESAPVTERYPYEIYYRIFAARFLPAEIDRVLYLDPDTVVLKNLDDLYSINLEGKYFAAASHVNKPLQKINEIRLQMEPKGPYINSGVMVMNIQMLRKHQNFNEVFDYIEKNKNTLFLPDQDIISAVYSDRIVSIDPYIYNMTEKMLRSHKSVKKDIDLEWIKNNSAIIHYCGRNKPWKNNYIGVLDSFYKQHSHGIDH